MDGRVGFLFRINFQVETEHVMPQRIQIAKHIHRRGDGDDGKTPDDINTGKVVSARLASESAAKAVAEINRQIGQ